MRMNDIPGPLVDTQAAHQGHQDPRVAWTAEPKRRGVLSPIQITVFQGDQPGIAARCAQILVQAAS